MTKKAAVELPGSFLWGASLGAHKVEGGCFQNDWWRWEQRPGRIRDGSSSKRAASHFERFREDIGLARRLGLKALMVSIEWSRVHTAPETIDHAALDHYGRVFQGLRENGLEPVCVLHEVTQPDWFAERFGWRSKAAPLLFERYARAVAERLSPLCRWWIPILEPQHRLRMAHIERAWPPGRFAPLRAVVSLRHTLKAQGRAAALIRDRRHDAAVGVSIRARACGPLSPHSAWDLRVARRENAWANRLVPDAVFSGKWGLPGPGPRLPAGIADFIAVSYDGPEMLRFDPRCVRTLFARSVDTTAGHGPPPGKRPDSDCLGRVLREAAGYGVPLLVTGAGFAASDDAERTAAIERHVGQVAAAISGGIDVRGYLHPALLDGFEWTEGYTVRRGLVHVDWETLARTPNPSAYAYRAIIDRSTASAPAHPGEATRRLGGVKP